MGEYLEVIVFVGVLVGCFCAYGAGHAHGMRDGLRVAELRARLAVLESEHSVAGARTITVADD